MTATLIIEERMIIEGTRKEGMRNAVKILKRRGYTDIDIVVIDASNGDWCTKETKRLSNQTDLNLAPSEWRRKAIKI
jgi:hypothetical protein